MPYAKLNWSDIEDRHLKKVFRHTDKFLEDVYGMFRCLPPTDRDGGDGTWSIALVLLCLVDGLATEVWPGKDMGQEERYKHLIRNRLHWGPEGNGKWVDKGTAAHQLYTEFRNPLVHELGSERQGRSRSRGPSFGEPKFGRWGAIPEELKDIEKIDALSKWDDAWPILSDVEDDQGARRKLALSGFYWAVKQLAKDLISDEVRKGTSS